MQMYAVLNHLTNSDVFIYVAGLLVISWSVA
jgi:hypothetical protein